MGDGVKRRYNSTGRRQQAADNQRRIIAAAHELFVAKGYAATTITEIASAAGVAAETVYAAFRNKPTLLHRAWDIAVGGDEQDVRLLDRPEMRAVFAEPDLPTRLTRFAAVNTPIMRRTARLLTVIQAAAEGDLAVADLQAEIDQARLDAMGLHARAAQDTGQLTVSQQECRDVLFATTDGSLWLALVQRAGWTDTRYASWLAHLWTAMLINPLRHHESAPDGTRQT